MGHLCLKILTQNGQRLSYSRTLQIRRTRLFQGLYQGADNGRNGFANDEHQQVFVERNQPEQLADLLETR